jgi:hypothetical protein
VNPVPQVYVERVASEAETTQSTYTRETRRREAGRGSVR